MNIELYNEIKSLLRHIIKGTVWENNVYAVGGCVRDDIMGSHIKDIDLCVSLPGGGIGFAQWLHSNGYTTKAAAVYPTYGTAMLHLKAFPDVELEFVQTRKERYIDHSCRNPETSFGTLEDDCMRRDLTINSLYCNISTDEIVDITGHGIEDIKASVIRTPNDPDITYDDDPLRILRCIRFASRYGWQIERTTYEGLVRNAYRLEIIAKERISDELNKMLTCSHRVMAMELLRTTGAMHFVFPELEQTYDMEQNHCHFGTVWQHTMAVLENLNDCCNLVVCMAALLHDVGKVEARSVENGKVHFLEHDTIGASMVVKMLKRLRYSNDFIDEVAFLVANHMVSKPWGDDCSGMKDKKLRRLQYACQTVPRFNRLLWLIDADNRAHAEGYCMRNQVQNIIRRSQALIGEGSAMFDYKLPLSGEDVMAIKGLKPGRAVKECLDFLMKLAYVDPLRSKENFVKHLIGYKDYADN